MNLFNLKLGVTLENDVIILENVTLVIEVVVKALLVVLCIS